MDLADQMMLASVRRGLDNPFRDPVRVSGQLMPRKLARQVERHLLRLRVLERRIAMPLQRAPHAVEGGADHDASAFAPVSLSLHGAGDARACP